MSRYSFQKQMEGGVVTVAYGFDHAMGYFYQEEGPDGELITDLDSLFHGLTGVGLAEKLCGSKDKLITQRFPGGVDPAHIGRMMVDLPF